MCWLSYGRLADKWTNDCTVRYLTVDAKSHGFVMLSVTTSKLAIKSKILQECSIICIVCVSFLQKQPNTLIQLKLKSRFCIKSFKCYMDVIRHRLRFSVFEFYTEAAFGTSSKIRRTPLNVNKA